MLYKLFILFHQFNKTARLIRWCKGKTTSQINQKFSTKVGSIFCLDNYCELIEILLKKGTLTCVIDNDVCKNAYYFSHTEYTFLGFPESMFADLKEGKYSTGKETINPDLFPEYDLSSFTWEKWACLRPIIVQRVCEQGNMIDFYAIVNQYGYECVRDTIQKDIKSFSNIDGQYLASAIFNIPLKEKTVKNNL